MKRRSVSRNFLSAERRRILRRILETNAGSLRAESHPPEARESASGLLEFSIKIAHFSAYLD